MRIQKPDTVKKEKVKERHIVHVSRESVYVSLLTVMLVFALAAVLFLTYFGCRYSYYSQRDYTQRISIITDKPWIWLIILPSLFAVVTFLGLWFSGLKEKVQNQIGLGVFLFSCAWILVVWSLYVWLNPYEPSGDQLITTAAASYARNGVYEMFMPGGYIGMYQQQKGLVMIYEFIFSVFGDFNYAAAKQIHVFLSVGALTAGYHFLKLHTGRIFPGILFCVLFLFCMPFLLYLPYIYGDIPAVSLCMVFFGALAFFERSGKKRFLVTAVIAAAFALLLRMNSWIVLIAVTIGLLMTALKRWSLKYVLAALLIILVPAAAVKAVDISYECRSGYESGIGIPSILWIAMGLQETDGAPGIYNRYQQGVFENHNFEKESAAKEGQQYIHERLKEFANDRSLAIDFFKRKLQMQWLEPLFESLYSTKNFEEGKKTPEWIESLYYGETHDRVWKFANVYQGIVYTAVLIFLLISLPGKTKREHNGTFWIPLIAIVGGFLFSIIWESQCRYVFPYFVFMLLYVPLGLEAPAQKMYEHYSKEKVPGQDDKI